jgi:DNA polymerase-3 subunit delta
MQLRPEQLEAHLQPLLPVYLVSGDEPLLVQEACDSVRRAAREQGVTEREVLVVEGRFDWSALSGSAAELSLFAERKLIELRIPSGKPGTEGSKALLAYLDSASPDNVLLVVAGRIDKASTNSKWYKALNDAGACISVWPVGERELPRWLAARLQQHGLAIERDALAALGERVEGNLLAAAQEIEKLRLTVSSERITLDDVTGAVADSARYNLFALVDLALQGEGERALRMLAGLRAEGTDANAVLWGLAREIRLLGQCRADLDRGQRPSEVFARYRVWRRREPLINAALKRHDRHGLERLLQGAARADRCIKGLAVGNPWDSVEQLTLALASDSSRSGNQLITVGA